jgi:hypothetical protein
MDGTRADAIEAEAADVGELESRLAALQAEIRRRRQMASDLAGNVEILARSPAGERSSQSSFLMGYAAGLVGGVVWVALVMLLFFVGVRGL